HRPPGPTPASDFPSPPRLPTLPARPTDPTRGLEPNLPHGGGRRRPNPVKSGRVGEPAAPHDPINPQTPRAPARRGRFAVSVAGGVMVIKRLAWAACLAPALAGCNIFYYAAKNAVNEPVELCDQLSRTHHLRKQAKECWQEVRNQYP